jgi:hypothetical protein
METQIPRTNPRRQQVNTITATGAHIMAQALCRAFVDQSPAHETPQDWVRRALVLQQSIGRIIGALPTVDDITELVTSLEEMESVECGTHPDLVRNEARTIDNSLALTERIAARINNETWALLNNAGFTTVRNVA